MDLSPIVVHFFTVTALFVVLTCVAFCVLFLGVRVPSMEDALGLRVEKLETVSASTDALGSHHGAALLQEACVYHRQEDRLASVVAMIATDTDKRLLTMFDSQFKLSIHLTALKKFLLLGQVLPLITYFFIRLFSFACRVILLHV